MLLVVLVGIVMVLVGLGAIGLSQLRTAWDDALRRRAQQPRPPVPPGSAARLVDGVLEQIEGVMPSQGDPRATTFRLGVVVVVIGAIVAGVGLVL